MKISELSDNELNLWIAELRRRSVGAGEWVHGYIYKVAELEADKARLEAALTEIGDE